MNSPATKARKRVREACEPCRRKKNRCPGEKPVCSYCARLGQTQSCTYAGGNCPSSLLDATGDASNLSSGYGFNADAHDQNTSLEDQVGQLDDKLSEVLDHVRLLSAVRSQTRMTADEDSIPPQLSRQESQLPPPELIHRSADLFLRYCHCQPLPLFHPRSFTSTFTTRDLEVQLCVAGISLRFDPDNGTRHVREASCTSYLDSARSLVMRKVSEGPVDLSTIQCLCLLALTDFNIGKHQQSGVYLSLAVELARGARLDLYTRNRSTSSRHEEHVRCMWSIIQLQYLCGGFGLMSVSVDTSAMRYPSIDADNDMALTVRQSSGVTQETDHDLGIVVYGLQMTEAWHRVRQYVQQRGKIDEYPPWSGQSIYSSIMFRQMEIESQMPHRHRFKPSRYPEHSAADISANRHYWAPWLYLQIIYHAIVCALNHPILLSIHLRRFRVNQVPELFLQHTADLIKTHTDWIIHLLELAREKQYEFSDPFLGQCIAIVATIFLQQSYTQDQEIRKEKQEKFLICLYIVQDLGRYWPYINQMAADLQKFESTMSKAYESSLMENSPNLSNLVDLSTFWKILDNTLSSSMASSSNTIFGPSLRSQIVSRAEGELLSTHLLPEPTRVDSLAQNASSVVSTPNARNGSVAVRNGETNTSNQPLSANPVSDMFLDTPFLAQNFFALGQDFVGNANDWFNWTDV